MSGVSRWFNLEEQRQERWKGRVVCLPTLKVKNPTSARKAGRDVGHLAARIFQMTITANKLRMALRPE